MSDLPEDEQEQPDLPVDDDIAAERDRLRKLRVKARQSDNEGAEFWRAVFASEIGRREMWNILERANALELNRCFAVSGNGFPHPEATWFAAGQSALGLQLWRTWLRVAPEGVVKMMAEHDPTMRAPPLPRRGRRVVTQ